VLIIDLSYGAINMKFGKVIIAIFSYLLFLSSCGGGGGGGEGSKDIGCFINTGIDEPTYQGTWKTNDSTIDLSGLLPIPGGNIYVSPCPDVSGTFEITWRNSSTSENGIGGAWSSQKYGILGPYCDTRWSIIGIPLQVGKNLISVSIKDTNGCTASDSITVTRTTL